MLEVSWRGERDFLRNRCGGRESRSAKHDAFRRVLNYTRTPRPFRELTCCGVIAQDEGDGKTSPRTPRTESCAKGLKIIIIINMYCTRACVHNIIMRVPRNDGKVRRANAEKGVAGDYGISVPVFFNRPKMYIIYI